MLTGDPETIGKLSMHDLEAIAVATLTGMSTDDYAAEVKAWIDAARDRRRKRPYTDLTYQPMQEVRGCSVRTATRPTSSPAAGRTSCASIPRPCTAFRPSRWSARPAGSSTATTRTASRPDQEPKLILNDDNAGKVEGIHLEIGRRPYAAFGNSNGDREMLEYTKAGGGMRLAMLAPHDDAEREYAYGPAQGLPNSKVGTFTQALYDEARKDDGSSSA